MLTALFLCATVLPYVAAAAVVRGGSDSRACADRRRFEIVVLGTGLLYGILHALVFLGRLSIPAVAACSAAAAVIVWWVQQRRAMQAWTGERGCDTRDAVNPPSTRWGELASTVLVAAICGLWLARSVGGIDVSGTDADHYHVPHAVNFALGASPWGPLATQHSYPMGTSVLFAWAILPFADAFVVDAVMVVWYLVLAVSIAALFRSLTGQSGWAWLLWPALVLAVSPLVQAAALPSADMAYTTSFLAATAQLTWMVGNQSGSWRDWAVLGVSLGLLVGSKTSGAYSAGLLVAPAAIAQFAARGHTPWPRPRAWLAPILIVTVAGFLTGGVWLVRNAWFFGSPVEILTDRYYRSVLAELRDIDKGEWSHLALRAELRIAQWLGRHFLLLGVAIGWLAVESAVLVARHRADKIARTRAWFLVLAAAVSAAHIAGILGAPWTSLEWTRGFSLRYLLPIWLLYALVAYAALFSCWFRWYESEAVRRCVLAALVVGSGLYAAEALELPRLLLTPRVPAALGATAAMLVLFWIVGSRVTQPSAGAILPRAAMLAAVLTSGGLWLDSWHAPLAAEARVHEAEEHEAWLGGVAIGADPMYRQVYLKATADEARLGLHCLSRRFFVASRFDAPLALQPATYTSVLIDSRRSYDSVFRLFRRAPTLGTCDYAVVSQNEPNRLVIRAGSSWLQPIDLTGEFLVYRVVRP